MRINIYVVQVSLAVAEWVFSDSFSFIAVLSFTKL